MKHRDLVDGADKLPSVQASLRFLAGDPRYDVEKPYYYAGRLDPGQEHLRTNLAYDDHEVVIRNPRRYENEIAMEKHGVEFIYAPSDVLFPKREENLESICDYMEETTRLVEAHLNAVDLVVALHYLGLGTPANIEFTQSVLIPLGKFYQYQNDYLDIFGDLERTGKVGTDIQENKCSWVAIQAWQMGNEQQRDILLKHYGQKSSASAVKCQQVFESLRLKEVYECQEEEVLGLLEQQVDGMDTSEGLRGELFWVLINRVRKVTEK